MFTSTLHPDPLWHRLCRFEDPPAPAPTPEPAPTPTPATPPPPPTTPPAQDAAELAKAQARIAELEAAETERQRKADVEAGNHAAIAERERKAREAAEARAKEAEDKLAETTTATERARLVTAAEKVATRLNFRDPEDVIGKLTDEQLATTASVEKRLKEIAAEKPYLTKGGGNPAQGDVTGDDPAGGGGGGGNTGQIGPGRLSKAYAESGNTT
jgi:hypothetical protein